MPTVFTNTSSTGEKPKIESEEICSDKITLLTSYALNPEKVRFETQQEGETILLFLRQHFIVNAPWLFAAFLLIIAPIAILPFIISLLKLSIVVPPQYILIGTLFWYLATIGFILEKFISWYFNIYIVTSERIVDIDFINLLVKRFTQAELSRVQNISYISSGIFATFFNFGNVRVETAGDSPNIECTLVPYPDKVVEMIRSVSSKGGKRI